MSYFSPLVGTVRNDPEAGTPVATGEPRDMVVTCADSKTVFGLVAGAEAWRIRETGYVRGAHLFEGLVFYAAGNRVKAVHPATGFVWREWIFARGVNAVWVGMLTNGPTMGVAYVCPNGPTSNSVELFEITPTGLRSIHLVAEPTDNARSLYVESGRVVIADTFGHRVLVTRVSTGYAETCTEVYFPNDVRPLPDGRVLVCAEHENRLFAWSRAGNSREMVLSAPVVPFSDIAMTRDQIVAAIPHTCAAAPLSPLYDPPKQSVAQEYHPGAISLYAPNAGFLLRGEHWIADTDNDRVIVVRDGRIATEVRVNNPVGVAAF